MILVDCLAGRRNPNTGNFLKDHYDVSHGFCPEVKGGSSMANLSYVLCSWHFHPYEEQAVEYHLSFPLHWIQVFKNRGINPAV